MPSDCVPLFPHERRVIHVLFLRKGRRLNIFTQFIVTTNLIVTAEAVYLSYCQVHWQLFFINADFDIFSFVMLYDCSGSGQTSSCHTPRAVTYAGSENYGSETGQMASLPHSTEI